MVFSFDSLSKIFYLWAFGFDFTFAISLGKENSDFFEMHHVSVTLRAKLLKDFIEYEGLKCMCKAGMFGFVQGYTGDRWEESKLNICE